jgi:tetratricopeptide (TPR) repeat protein
MKREYNLADKIGHVLAVFTLAGLFAFVYLNMVKELTDPDIWLHLKTGKFILTNFTIPYSDPFSSVLAAKPWVDHSWLLQVAYSLIFDSFGADGLLVFSGIVLCAAFMFLFLSVYKNRGQLVILTGLFYLTVMAGVIRFNIRPENLSVLFFAIFIFGLARLCRSKWLYILVFIQLLWVNFHGFFILGPAILGISLIGEKDKEVFNNLRNVFLLTLAACFVNPYGIGGALYPLRIIFNNDSALFYSQIRELLPTWRCSLTVIFPYYLLIAVSLTVIILNFRRLKFSRVFIWLILLAISVNINRNVIYFNFFAFFLTAELLAKNLNTDEIKWQGCKKAVGLIVCAVILVLIVNMAEGLLKARYYIPQERRYKSILFGANKYHYPREAADFTIEKGLPENLFNFFNHGSYLIFRLGPQKKVFIDGRTELYGQEFYQNYYDIITGDTEKIPGILNKYKVNTIFLSGVVSEISGLAVYFYSYPQEWALVYFGQDALIFIRNSPENYSLIKQLRIDLRRWQTEKIPAEQLPIDHPWPNPYIRRAWLLYHFKLYSAALQEAQEALKILPSCSDAYIIRGKIYTRERDFTRAYEALRLACIYAPKDAQTLISLGEFYLTNKEFEKAEKSGRKIILEHPKFAKGYCLLAQCYIKQGKIQPASAMMKKAYEIDPKISAYSKELSDLTANTSAAQVTTSRTNNTFTRWIKRLLNLR